MGHARNLTYSHDDQPEPANCKSNAMGTTRTEKRLEQLGVNNAEGRRLAVDSSTRAASGAPAPLEPDAADDVLRLARAARLNEIAATFGRCY